MSKKKKEAILIVVISFSVIFAIFTMYFLHFQMVRRADKTLGIFDACSREPRAGSNPSNRFRPIKNPVS